MLSKFLSEKRNRVLVLLVLSLFILITVVLLGRYIYNEKRVEEMDVSASTGYCAKQRIVSVFIGCEWKESTLPTPKFATTTNGWCIPKFSKATAYDCATDVKKPKDCIVNDATFPINSPFLTYEAGSAACGLATTANDCKIDNEAIKKAIGKNTIQGPYSCWVGGGTEEPPVGGGGDEDTTPTGIDWGERCAFDIKLTSKNGGPIARASNAFILDKGNGRYDNQYSTDAQGITHINFKKSSLSGSYLKLKVQNPVGSYDKIEVEKDGSGKAILSPGCELVEDGTAIKCGYDVCKGENDDNFEFRFKETAAQPTIAIPPSDSFNCTSITGPNEVSKGNNYTYKVISNRPQDTTRAQLYYTCDLNNPKWTQVSPDVVGAKETYEFNLKVSNDGLLCNNPILVANLYSQYNWVTGNIKADPNKWSISESCRLNIILKEGITSPSTPPVGGATNPNLLRNGSFDTGISWWHYAISSGSHKTGNLSYDKQAKSAKVTITANGNRQFYQSQIQLNPGKEYELSFKAKANRNNAYITNIYIHKHATGTPTYFRSNKIQLSDRWQTYTIRITPSNLNTVETNARLRFWFNGVSVGTIYWFDDIVLKEK